MTAPLSIVILAGSPSRPSRTAALAGLVERQLVNQDFRVRTVHVRDLPAQALLHAQCDDPELRAAFEAVAQADGVVLSSPVYKASYSGLLKAFLDLLPQRGLAGKVVLPLMTGGSLAHVLALDYALRPMLQSMEPRLIVTGLFVIEKWLSVHEDGAGELDSEIAPRFEAIVQSFVDELRLT